MKFTWLLAFKIFIALFWLVIIVLLLFAVINSSKGIVYYLFNDFMFQYFLLIGFLGLLSIALEKFYSNIIFKYFIFSFFLASCYCFLCITFEFMGVAKSNLKGIYLTFNSLLIHYCINCIFFCLSIFGIYNLFRNNVKFLYICFTLLYLFMYIFFYGAVVWDSPIKIIDDKIP